MSRFTRSTRNQSIVITRIIGAKITSKELQDNIDTLREELQRQASAEFMDHQKKLQDHSNFSSGPPLLSTIRNTSDRMVAAPIRQTDGTALMLLAFPVVEIYRQPVV